MVLLSIASSLWQEAQARARALDWAPRRQLQYRWSRPLLLLLSPLLLPLPLTASAGARM